MVVLSVIVVIVMIVLLAVYNPNVAQCGYSTFSANVSFDPQTLSLRENVDIFGLNADGSKGSKQGEIFKKLVTKSDIFRLVNQDGNLIASLTKNSATQYTVDPCTAGADFVIQKQEFLRGNCSSDPNWFFNFQVSSNDGISLSPVLTSGQVPKNATTVNFYDVSNSQVLLASMTKQADGWTIYTKQNSTFSSSYIFNFFPLIMQKYNSLGFDCNTASSSPSFSATSTPSTSPTPSHSHSSASQLVPVFCTLFSLVLSFLFLLH